MCGRFAFYSPAEAAAALFGVDATVPSEPRYNIAPTQPVPAIRCAEGQDREFVMLRWGLIPYWAKDPSIGNRLINARAETVAEKPAFREAYRRRRCIILADGFYEWQKDAAGKTPYFISLASGEPFAFAGLWERWMDRDTGELLQTATIVTTVANDFIARLHDRMPVILQPDAASAWLAREPNLLDTMRGDPPELQAWPVGRKVNNARNEGAELVRSTLR